MGTNITENIQTMLSNWIKTILKDSTKLKAVKNDPEDAARNLTNEIKTVIPDTKVYRMIVIALAVVSFTALVGAIVLVALQKTPIDAVIAIGSAAVGALAGTLIPQKQG